MDVLEEFSERVPSGAPVRLAVSGIGVASWLLLLVWLCGVLEGHPFVTFLALMLYLVSCIASPVFHFMLNIVNRPWMAQPRRLSEAHPVIWFRVHNYHHRKSSIPDLFRRNSKRRVTSSTVRQQYPAPMADRSGPVAGGGTSAGAIVRLEVTRSFTFASDEARQRLDDERKQFEIHHAVDKHVVTSTAMSFVGYDTRRFTLCMPPMGTTANPLTMLLLSPLVYIMSIPILLAPVFQLWFYAATTQVKYAIVKEILQ